MSRFNLPRSKVSFLLAAHGAALACCVWLPALAWAQGAKSKRGAEPEKKSGTVAEVKKKGKAATLTVEQSDGEKFDVDVTAKTSFMVKGRGDAAFFKHPNVSVSADNVVMNQGNKYLFGRKFTVHLGNRPPAERFEPDPTNPSVYLIGGPVVGCAEDSFTFEADGATPTVHFEQGVVPEILVESTEFEHAAVGSPVEIEGTTRGSKFHPTAILVTLEKPMVADEVFAGDKKSAKSKHGSKASKKNSKADKDKDKSDKSADTGDDAKGGDPFKKDASDPFGVSKDKKDSKKGKSAPQKKDKKPADDSDNS
jgi:hypothetical protein